MRGTQLARRAAVVLVALIVPLASMAQATPPADIRSAAPQATVEPQRWAEAGLELAADSDELDTRLVSGVFGWRPTTTSSLEIGARVIDLSQPTGDARGERLGATWRRPWSVSNGTSGIPVERGPVWTALSVQANRYDDWRPVTGAARLHWQATDTTRFDAELGREVVETPQTIANRITIDVASLGGDWRWHPRASVGSAVSALKFSDDNQRLRINLRADYRFHARPKVVAGIESMAFRSSDPTSATQPYVGYWNPRSYREARAFVLVAHDARPWDLSLKVGLGTGREEDALGNRNRANPNVLELSATRDLDPALRLRIQAGGSGGSMGVTSGGEGYWRRYAGITLSGWF